MMMYRCLTCWKTEGTPSPGGEDWFSYWTATGKANPFCSSHCLQKFAAWDILWQMEAVYGDAAIGFALLAARHNQLTKPADHPTIYPAENGELKVGPARVYRITGQSGEDPIFSEYGYPVKA